MTSHQTDGTIVSISQDFSSRSEDYRHRLRLALRTQIETEAQKLGLSIDIKSRESLMDLSAPPRIPNWGISISHCPGFGGFALKPNSLPIGLDIEVANRVSEAVAQRVATTPEEKQILSAIRSNSDLNKPSPSAFFWCAKEASIKVRGHLFSDIPSHFGNIELLALDISRKSFSARGTSLGDPLYICGEFLDVSTPDLVVAFATVDRLKSRR